MTIQHLTPSDYITTKWSGGLTTQLGIAPAGAVYADRDFLWRLSSATVEDAESDFTALPDYERLISTLEGTIELFRRSDRLDASLLVPVWTCLLLW